jgi:hypothetical protein
VEGKLTAMTLFAASVLVSMIVGIAALLERNDRRNTAAPRVPFGADVSRDTDLWRIRHDLDVARPAH